MPSTTSASSKCSWGTAMRPDTLLEALAIEASYGRVQVLWGVDLEVRDRETVVRLGANGAGKTTLWKTLLGLIPHWHGAIRFGGQDISLLRTDRRVRRGIVYMSETAVFPGMTIEENIRIGGQFLAKSALKARTAELFAIFPALPRKPRALAPSLSGRQRQMPGIAQALPGHPAL